MATRGTGSTKSDSPVAAREQLDQQQEGGGPDPKAQEREAKAQEKTQREELATKQRGKAARAAQALQEKADEVPAAARAGAQQTAPTRGGFMDQLSRRSGADALEGHYVTVDLNDNQAKQAYEDMFGTDDDGELNHAGTFGVFLEPQLRDPETGIPITAMVQLRDDTHARVTVPYECLSPAAPRGRS